MPTFVPPTADTVQNYRADADPVAKAFGRHFKLRACGKTVIKEDGVYRTKSYPTQAELEAADAYYLGGHIYEVSAAEATALTAAGFTVI